MTGYTIVKHGDSQIVIWEGLKADDTGIPLDCTFLDVHTVSFEGEFGDGGCVVMEGSLSGKFHNLETSHGGIISSMSEGMENLNGRYLSVRPNINGGSEETSIDVYLFCDTIPKRRAGK